MNFRKILAAAAIAAGIAMVPATADAKTNVYVGIGVDRLDFYDPYEHYGEYPYYGGGYYRRPIYRRISCGAGANVVRDHGYRGVHVRDCGGRTYSYVGWRRGGRFLVFVDARNGVVVGRRPI